MDARLVRVLLALVHRRPIAVSLIKTGHPMGPTTPNGRPNAHYYGRAGDIVAVDGTPVAGNGAASGLVDLGRMLRAMPPEERPDSIMGPAEWHRALGDSASAGFVSDPFHDAIHADHLHLGFESESGTSNRE